MIVRTPKATWKYVLLSDRFRMNEKGEFLFLDGKPIPVPREEATVWHLKHLTLAQEARMYDSFEANPETGKLERKREGEVNLEHVRTNLTGWTNLRNANGEQVAFEAGPLGGPTDALLQCIGLVKRVELARAIENELEYDPDEVGKSSPASA